jgi:exopolyphosphatase / guanosine-5'-triphosphate,3'-diphosphate pyrophosphatase
LLLRAATMGLRVVLGAFLTLAPQLAQAKRNGLREYGTLAESYARWYRIDCSIAGIRLTMAEITARWEWRSFGGRFGEAEGQLARFTPSDAQESDEIYLLSPAGGNVKIRDALMDIKVLREVNAEGLEQWTPVMKAGFPLPAAEALKVLEALGLPIPTPMRASYTQDEFIAQFAAPGAAVRAVKVHKRRTRYTVGGCMAELSDVVVNGKPTRTIAVESQDAAGVMRAVRELGLGGYTNTSYPRGMAALINDEPVRYAVIDAGTNSIKFHIAEHDVSGKWRSVVDRAELTRLGEGLAPRGAIIDAALERTAAAIASMVAEAKRNGVRAIAAVGTAGLRIASNGSQVVAAIQARTGVHIEVISGEEEGRLAYVAAKAGIGLSQGSLVVFDTGGGSSQFSFGHDASVDERFSVDVGAVRYTERYRLDRAVSPEVLREAMAAISADLSRIDGRPVPGALVAMGGAVTNIAAVMHRLAAYDAAVVQGSVIDRAEIDRQIELYRSRDADARRAIVGLQPKRAEVILAGACIVRTVMDKLGKQSFIVSDRGLRHGVLAELFGA